MAASINKIITLTVKYSYSDAREIAEDDMNVETLRAKLVQRITELAYIQKGDLNVNFVSITEA